MNNPAVSIILRLAQSNPRIVLMNVGVLILVLLGATLNGWMLAIALRRNRLVRMTGEAQRDKLADLTMRRATRCEGVYFSIQVLMLGTSLWQFAAVVPEMPMKAIDFFFVSMAVRATASGLLLYLSVRDLIDRRAAARELDLLHPETPASQVG
jgi:hypothetical protein